MWAQSFKCYWQEMIGECCHKHGLCPYDPRDRVLMAEYLGLICIEEVSIFA